MSDLFDLPFEDDNAEVDSPQSTGGSPDPRPAVSDRPLDSDRRPPPVDRPPIRRVHTVTELTIRVRDHLEAEFFEVWVEGELSNCRPWNGHLYFTLKDSTSQLRGFMFRSNLRYLKFKPADGLRVVARGKLSVYEPKANISWSASTWNRMAWGPSSSRSIS